MTTTEPTAGLTRVTANLTPRATAALDRLCVDGTNRTDAINRACLLAAVVQDLTGGGPLTVTDAAGATQTIHFV